MLPSVERLQEFSIVRPYDMPVTGLFDLYLEAMWSTRLPARVRLGWQPTSGYSTCTSPLSIFAVCIGWKPLLKPNGFLLSCATRSPSSGYSQP